MHDGHQGGGHSNAVHSFYGLGGNADAHNGTDAYAVHMPPHGVLAMGIGGLSYAATTHSLVGSHVTAAAHAHSVSDYLALAIAMEIAGLHGHSGALSGFRSGHCQSHPLLQTVRSGSQQRASDAGRLVNFPGISRTKTTIEVLQWPHGKCDARAKFIELAKAHGMFELAPSTQYMEATNKPNINGILDNQPFVAISDPKSKPDPNNMPNGWFRKANGRTHVWQEFWCIKPPFRLLGIGANEVEDRRTYLAVTGVTYMYEQTGDCETRISFSICTTPYCKGGQWKYRWDQVRKNRDLAEHLAKAMLSFLEQHPASATAIAKRQALTPEELTAPTVSAPAAPAMSEVDFSGIPPVTPAKTDEEDDK
jgi:hypothetical protein